MPEEIKGAESRDSGIEHRVRNSHFPAWTFFIDQNGQRRRAEEIDESGEGQEGHAKQSWEDAR